MGNWGTCTAEVTPAKEICDNKDNDCDTKVDEEVKQACYTGAAGTSGVGLCKDGTQTCSAGKWSACTGDVVPTIEACDNKDNDCDGKVDDGVTRFCYTGTAGTKGVGECKEGTQTCTTGTWGACASEVLPVKEVCDGKDNNCDGQTDEAWTNCAASAYTSQYQCSKNILQRQYLKSGCSGGKCSSTAEWHKDKDCGSGDHNTCSSWSYYCSSSNRMRQRTCYKRGCASASCFNTAWTQTEKVEACATSTYSEYNCSGSMRRRRTCNKGCFGDACSTTCGSWYNDKDCGSGSLNNCGTWTYYCSGTSRMRKRTCYKRGCSGTSCYDTAWTQSESAQACPTGQYYEYSCYGADRQRRSCNKGCYGGACKASCGGWSTSQKCGSGSYNSCGSWSYYCSGNDQRRKRTCYKRGCSGTSCFSTAWTHDEKYKACSTGGSYEYQCSGTTQQKRSCSKGCYSGKCTTSCGTWANNQSCGSGSYNSCGGWTYYCSGTSRMRKRTCYKQGCSGKSCFKTAWVQSEKSESCPTGGYSEYKCSGSTRQRRTCTKGCYSGTCKASCGGWSSYQSCGSGSYNSCGGWTYYCSGSSRMRKRTCYKRGCSGNSCYSTPWTHSEKVQSCTVGTYYAYQCSGATRQRRLCTNGCYSGSCSTSCGGWGNYQSCGSGSYNSCSGWSYYCSGTNRRRKRTCYTKGCAGSACYSTAWTDYQADQSCGTGSYNACYHTSWVCSGGKAWRKKICYKRGCASNKCYNTPWTEGSYSSASQAGASGCKLYYWDKDNDGYYGTSAASQCLCGPYSIYRGTKAGDCDDDSWFTHKGQTGYSSTPRKNYDKTKPYTAYDHNCDGKAEKQYTGTSWCHSWLFGGCDHHKSGDGYWHGGVPDCGKAGYKFNKCEGPWHACNTHVWSGVYQACR